MIKNTRGETKQGPQSAFLEKQGSRKSALSSQWLNTVSFYMNRVYSYEDLNRIEFHSPQCGATCGTGAVTWAVSVRMTYGGLGRGQATQWQIGHTAESRAADWLRNMDLSGTWGQYRANL